MSVEDIRACTSQHRSDQLNQREHTRNINPQDNNEEPPIQRVQLSSGRKSFIDQGTFTGDSEGIENVEGVISIPISIQAKH